MAKQTGALVFTVGADTRPLGRNLKKARGMLTGFGAGIGRVGAGLGKVGLGAGLALGGAILAARGAFKGLMKLAPYSDDLATALGNMINVQEDLKRRMATALVPAVDSLAKSMTDAAPMLADMAVGLFNAATGYMEYLSGLSRPSDEPWWTEKGARSISVGFVSALMSEFAGNDKTAAQTMREQFPSWTAEGGDTVFQAGEAGQNQLGAGARGEGRAGEFNELVSIARDIERNTANGGGF